MAQSSYKSCENYEETPNHFATAQCHGRFCPTNQFEGEWP
jgi:hypothetical protein